MLPLTSTHWYTWQINFGGLNTDNMNEMSGTGAKLTEGALKLGRALGVLENPKVRCYAGIMKICINLTFFFPQSSAAMKQTEKYVQNAMKNKLCVKYLLFFSWMGNGKLSFILCDLNATCCRHEFGDESLWNRQVSDCTDGSDSKSPRCRSWHAL